MRRFNGEVLRLPECYRQRNWLHSMGSRDEAVRKRGPIFLLLAHGMEMAP